MPTDGNTLRPRRLHAAVYDYLCRSGERGGLAGLRAELLTPLAGDVLEIGIGTGGNLRHYGAGVRLTATEPDPHMLARARGRLSGAVAARPNLLQSIAERQPFPDVTFDAVVSTLVLCTVMDLDRALVEIRRVLRPRGKLVFLEHVRAGGWRGRAQDTIRPVWSWCAGGCIINRQTEAAIVRTGLDVHVRGRRSLGGLPLIWGTASKPGN